LIDHARLAHFLVKIIAFPAPFAYSGKYGNAAVFHSDVVDQLLDDNSLADTRATKCADFAAFCKWANEIDDLDPSFQDLCRCVLIRERWRRAMDWVTFRVVHRAAVINHVASDVKKPAKHRLAYWYGNRTASIGYAHSPLQPFRRRHCYGANPAFAKMLLHFKRQLGWVAIHFVLDFEGVVDFGQRLFVRKFHIHYGTDYLNYVSFIHKS
jgi:hypothetical protein